MQSWSIQSPHHLNNGSMASMAATMETTDLRGAEKLDVSYVPERILLFSGKRKSGKDYITDIFHHRIGSDDSVILKISGPIKSHWAKRLNLDLDGLLGDGKYKEKYRLEMAKWGEEIRNKDPGYFCRAAIDMYNANTNKIWIVSDIRRKSDIKWFRENYRGRCKTIRVVSSEETRKCRGWVFTKGIDDSETECDLDDVQDWDLIVTNDNEDISSILRLLSDLIQ